MRADPLFEQDSDPKRPYRVLIVKLTSMGDVVHTLPVVQDLLRWRDDIVVDWVVEEPFADIVRRAGGIRRVIPCNFRKWFRNPFSPTHRAQWKAFVATLRSERYDAVFDLQGLSKSALVAGMARMTIPGQRIAMANRTEGSSYEVLTRLAADVAIRLEPHVHAVTRGRLLCAKSQNYELPATLDFGLHVAKRQGTATAKVMLVTGSSRANKTWPTGHWAAMVGQLSQQGMTSLLVHGTEPELAECKRIMALLGADAKVVLLPRLALSDLIDEMAQCQGVIGIDSGLSHLGVALGLQVVQIYNFDTAWRTGPLASPHQQSVFGRPSPSVDQVMNAWRSVTAAGDPVPDPKAQALPV
jgi:heptosyltransferase-1